MKIELTRNKIALIDDEDYSLIKDHKWVASQWGDFLYATTIINRKMVYMHRILLDVTDPRLEVDHKNHNTLDNRRENLRIVNRSQQHMNQKIRSDNTSGYKGVSWHSTQGKWTARIMIDGKRKTLGYFHDKIEAAKAYDEAALKHYGEFARINFPGE